MIQQETIRDLARELEQRQVRISELQAEIRQEEITILQISNTIALLTGGEIEQADTGDELPSFSLRTKQIHPQDAIRQLFVDNPTCEIKHSEIGARLEELSKGGRLRTQTSKIFVNFGYLVKRLIDEGTIENVGKKGKPVYRLKSTTEDESRRLQTSDNNDDEEPDS